MMSIPHKFIQYDFGDGFETHNAILDTVPYAPRIMIMGTSNPGTPNANYANFFYGRNFFWPAFFNLFKFNSIHYSSRRMPTNGQPQFPLDPSLSDMLKLCAELKLTFSDLVLNALHNCNGNYEVLENDNVIFDRTEYNLINDSMDRRGIRGLSELHEIGQIEWNTGNMIKYLSETPSIDTVYFTRNPTGVYLSQWRSIIEQDYNRAIRFLKIYTPSGANLRGTPRMTRLLQHWLHNNHQNYDRLNHDWLSDHGVDIELFGNR